MCGTCGREKLGEKNPSVLDVNDFSSTIGLILRSIVCGVVLALSTGNGPQPGSISISAIG
jgi:hypothetical protein